MVASNSFAEFLREQLAPLGRVTMRRMFGKTGVFCDGFMFGTRDNGDSQAALNFSQNRVGPYQGGRPSALSKSLVNRGEQRVYLHLPTLYLPSFGQTQCRAQFPIKRLLLAREFDRAQENPFRSWIIRIAESHKSTLDALQFRHVFHVIGLLRRSQRRLDFSKTFGCIARSC
jgi:hypothetical protein